jgi:hypothetical protein
MVEKKRRQERFESGQAKRSRRTHSAMFSGTLTI